MGRESKLRGVVGDTLDEGRVGRSYPPNGFENGVGNVPVLLTS